LKDVEPRYSVSEATIYRWLKGGTTTGFSKDDITSIDVASLESYLRT
jgi:transposase